MYSDKVTNSHLSYCQTICLTAFDDVILCKFEQELLMLSVSLDGIYQRFDIIEQML